MKYFMESLLYWNQLRNGTIATAQPNCNGKTLSKMILPLPPLAEQKRIVAKIEELLLHVDHYAAAYEKLEQFNAKFPEDMKKSVLQYAIQGKSLRTVSTYKMVGYKAATKFARNLCTARNTWIMWTKSVSRVHFITLNQSPRLEWE